MTKKPFVKATSAQKTVTEGGDHHELALTHPSEPRDERGLNPTRQDLPHRILQVGGM